VGLILQYLVSYFALFEHSLIFMRSRQIQKKTAQVSQSTISLIGKVAVILGWQP